MRYEIVCWSNSRPSAIEAWSPEQLRVMILARLDLELGDALDSKRHRTSPCMISRSTSARRSRACRRVCSRPRNCWPPTEVAEFLLRLYQAHGDVSAETRERTEQVLRRAANEAVQPLAPLFQRDPNGFALHYRGERIAYDCLTESVKSITSAESGVASDAEIEQRILDTSSKICAKWVTVQTGGSGRHAEASGTRAAARHMVGRRA